MSDFKFYQMKNPIFLALDVDTQDQVRFHLNRLKDHIGGIKLGPRLINKFGETLIQECAKVAPVFVDQKFFDITSTMEAAVRSAFDSGATFVTVHALSSGPTLEKLARLEEELTQRRPFKILAVTLLTSWSENHLPPVFEKKNISEHVKVLSDLVISSGLTGLVCSPHELDLIQGQDIFKVTPGIRFDKNTVLQDDQNRTMTPEQALKKGSSALVIGRPLLNADHPQEEIKNILKME